MHFPSTTIFYILLFVGPSALAGSPKPTDLACAGSVGPGGHYLYTRNEQAQPQGIALQPKQSIRLCLRRMSIMPTAMMAMVKVVIAVRRA